MVKVARALIGRGADVNAKGAIGLTPLHFAAQFGSATIVKALLEPGAVSVAMEHGHTPLDIAAANGHGPVIELLRAAG